MPRELRKRGKKHKKNVDAAADGHDQTYESQYSPEETFDQPQAGPSWIVSAPGPAENRDAAAPFGYVDAEVKAYFRTVDLQIREWQEQRDDATEGGKDVDPNEDRRLFFVAALTEMSEKEKQLATDPDCSNILERMAYSMDDFVRRVFLDRLAGSYEELFKHRFASHVCQTLFTVARDTIARESRGIFPPTPELSDDEGELRTLKQLIMDVCEEVLPIFPSLIMDQFASHVVRALFALLLPELFPHDSNSVTRSSVLRSRKSAAYKARQGPLRSVFKVDEQVQKSATTVTLEEFRNAAAKFVSSAKDQLGENEIRALAASPVGSPVLKMLLEVEAEQGVADVPGSLMDHVLMGAITICHKDPQPTIEASDYISALLRDPTSSHVLETLVSRAPDSAFLVLWQTYFKGKLARLAAHPVANFVVARALERVVPDELEAVCDELSNVWGKIIKSSRTGIFRAMIDRAAALQSQEETVMESICQAFEMFTAEERKLFVPCILRLLPLEAYREALTSKTADNPQEPDDAERSSKRGKKTQVEDPMEPKTQGAILLQAMLRLRAPFNQLVLDSIDSLNKDELFAMTRHVTSSRVLDAVLDSPSVPIKAKRKFVLGFLGQFHVLVDDRIGSRVGDRCWAFADPYLKEKIARSLIPHEQALAASFYGKFFARHLSLHLLQRNPEQWKDMQANSKAASQVKPEAQATQPVATTQTVVAERPAPGSSEATSVDTSEKRKRKRKARAADEIDELFDEALGKKVKKAGLGNDLPVHKAPAPEVERKKRRGDADVKLDKGLSDVLGAIKAAPTAEDSHRKKKRAR